jgi:hypothetical protein
MNHRHRKVVHAIFAHPVPANLDFKEVQSTLKELGAEIEDRNGSRIAVSLKGHTVLFHHAQHSVPKDEVVQIRRFLTDCGIDPEQYPL